MKNKFLTIAGIAICAIALGLNLQNAFDGYGVKKGTLHPEVLAQTTTGGGTSGGGTSGGGTTGGGTTGGGSTTGGGGTTGGATSGGNGPKGTENTRTKTKTVTVTHYVTTIPGWSWDISASIWLINGKKTTIWPPQYTTTSTTETVTDSFKCCLSGGETECLHIPCP